MRTLMFLLILSVTVVSSPFLHAQNSKPASRPPARAASGAAAKTPQPAAAPAAFNTAGLQNEDDFLHIYSGEFSKVRNRAGKQVETLTVAYMNTFSERCKAYLPANKVPIMDSVCTKTSQLVDEHGNVVPGSVASCAEYTEVNTGRFADPALMAATRKASGGAGRQEMKEMTGVLTGRTRNPMDMVTHLMAGLPAISSDVGALFQENACDSPGMKKFQANLIRFANGEAGTFPSNEEMGGYRENGYVPYDTDYNRLLHDLVTEASHSWTKNKYGGIINGIVRTTDSAGRPTKVTSDFQYYPPKSQNSVVTLTLKAGVPECLYFDDDPHTCVAPSPRIVSDYLHKEYDAKQIEDSGVRRSPATPASAAQSASQSPIARGGKGGGIGAMIGGAVPPVTDASASRSADRNPAAPGHGLATSALPAPSAPTVQAPVQAAPTQQNASASPPLIPVGTRLIVRTQEIINLKGDESRSYRAQLERPVTLAGGAILPQGAEIILKTARTDIPANARVPNAPRLATVNITAQSLTLNGRSISLTTNSVPQVIYLSPVPGYPTTLPAGRTMVFALRVAVQN
jgi:hypothetical protein